MPGGSILLRRKVGAVIAFVKRVASRLRGIRVALTAASLAFTTMLVGHRLLRIPTGMLVGMLAGIQTQPADLAFASERTRNDLPNAGYAAVYPVATIAKLLLAQLLLGL